MYNFLFGKKNQLVKGWGAKSKGKNDKRGKSEKGRGNLFFIRWFLLTQENQANFFFLKKNMVFFPQ